jgi:TonB dependent receptor/CarboxypepD_reg-like domain/TonB-dependent Receptor Plug Domain
MLSKLLLTVASLLLAGSVTAGTIKGRVLETGTGEPVIGANVLLDGTNRRAVSGLDGSYTIKNVAPGQYTLKISYVSYKAVNKAITVESNVPMNIDILLESAEEQTLREVTVVAKREGDTDNSARTIEQNANQVMNIVSGKTIQLSPDLTVANVIQRVSGISIERNSNGDGQYAILRGMDKRYNYTLVNGVKIPSPDNRYRYVPLDIFPAELLDRLEVYKALTPSMEGDAVGGAVNMVMRDAPNQLSVTANLATGYGELFGSQKFQSYDYKSVNPQSPYEQFGNTYSAKPGDFSKATSTYTSGRPAPNLIGGFAIGNRFLDRRLGVMVAGSIQNTFRGSNSLFFNGDVVDTLRSITLTSQSERKYSEQQNRYGLHAKLDFRANNRHKFQWYNAFMNLTNVQIRDTKGTSLGIGGYDPVLGNAGLSFSTRSRLTKQQIFNSTLQGDHKLTNKLRLNWSAVYSFATNAVPDQTTISLLGERKNFVERRTYPTDGARRWDHNSDTDLAAYANATYTSNLGGFAVDWQVGGLYRDKKRENFYNNYQVRPANLFALYGTDFQDYSQIVYVIQNPLGAVATSLTYDATEKVAAGFFQAKAQSATTEIVGGLRVENTNQGYTMRFPIGESRPTGSQVYTDFLASLHLKYSPVSRVNYRASYYRAINRPGYFEIVPYRIVNEEYQERGNPDLKRAIADNFDLRYELFPRPLEQFMIGAFYKRIQNPIEYTLQPDANRGQDIYYAPGNFGNATNYGLEIDFIKYFSRIGIKANYTFTQSEITTPKSKRIRDAKGDLALTTVNQTRPLYGQSAHIANLTLLFKDTRTGWDLQLAGNYTGERINTVSQYVNNDLWQKAFVQVDASLEKGLPHGFSLFAKANNLLNTPTEVFIKSDSPRNDGIPFQSQNGQTLIRRDYFQRSYVLGIRYRLQ